MTRKPIAKKPTRSTPGTAPLKASNPKEKIGATKLPLHLWPRTATAMGCLGMLVGRQSYGRENFRTLGALATTYVDALGRHMNAWMEGEDVDPDSGIPHLAHALSCLAIIVDTQAAKVLVDDRCSPGGYRDLITELTPHVARVIDMYSDKDPVHYTLQGGARKSEQ